MRPVFRTLSPEESRALLARHRVGRIAYAYRQRVDIEPLHYALDGDWLYLRTQHGTKLTMLAHQPWVAVEVDEVRDLFDWTSVVVHGSVQRLDEADDGARHAHAVTVFRRVVPAAFSADDPTPERDVLLRVHLDHVEGRSATPG